jgi:DNA repair exonuclease SbcCD nuclease subunit
VLTNDLQTPKYKLKISGMVKKFVTIEPRVVRFEGKPGEVLKSIVTIIFEKNYPFIINKSKAQVGEWIQYTIEPWEDESKKGYKLVVVNQKKEAGSYRDAIILETDSLIQPEIRINIIARLMEEQTNTTTNPDNQNLNEFIKKLKSKKANTSGNIKKSPVQATDAKKMFEELIKKAQQKKEQENLSN